MIYIKHKINQDFSSVDDAETHSKYLTSYFEKIGRDFIKCGVELNEEGSPIIFSYYKSSSAGVSNLFDQQTYINH